MSHDLNKPAPNPVFDEWITLLTNLTPTDIRTLSRYLAANDFHPPTGWEFRVTRA